VAERPLPMLWFYGVGAVILECSIQRLREVAHAGIQI
jgi:hypothetical protein